MLAGLITIADSCYLALIYERSRATGVKVALANYLSWLPLEISRARQLGFKDYLRLVRLELACARVGLGYPRESQTKGPPWQIPTRFVGLDVADMPLHSLIDPQELLKTRTNGDGDAVDALLYLLSDAEAASRRWSGLSRISGPANEGVGDAKIAICVHLFYPEMWPEINAALNSINERFDLYVTVPSYVNTPELHRIAAEHPGTRFFATDNRGRDVMPFLRLLRWGYFDCYDVVCKLHSKRSPHMQDGIRWRKELFSSLLGSKELVSCVLDRFRSDPHVGMIGAESSCIQPGMKGYIGSNSGWLRLLRLRAGFPEPASQRSFFAGTMFWFKPSAFQGLRDLSITEREFPLEMSQTDGTPAHAIERLIWPLVEAAGYCVEQA